MELGQGMIDPAILNAYPATKGIAHGENQSAAKSRLYMRRDPDDRMAGSIPVWESKKINAPQENSAATPDFKAALSHNAEDYNDIEPAVGPHTSDADDEFGFEDLVDIVNPLHHIPLVNIVYQNLTGDTIKPAGRIIGGAVFGGFVGAAAGIANVIIEEETGKDVAGNVVAMVNDGKLPKARPGSLSPEEQLNQAARMAFNDDITAEELPPLPAMALGLQQQQPLATKTNAPLEITEPRTRYEYKNDDDNRMAGSRPPNKPRTQHVQSAMPLPQTVLIDPISVNLAQIRADQMNEITSLHLTPLPPPQE